MSGSTLATITSIAATPPHSAIMMTMQMRMRGSAFAAWISNGRVKRSPMFQPTIV